MSITHYLVLVARRRCGHAARDAARAPVRARTRLRATIPAAARCTREPVVRIGGIAIFAGVMACDRCRRRWGSSYFGWGGTLIGGGTARATVLGVMIGLVLIFLTGLLDDFRPLSPGWKFAGAAVAAGVVVASGLRIEYIGNPFGRRADPARACSRFRSR